MLINWENECKLSHLYHQSVINAQDCILCATISYKACKVAVSYVNKQTFHDDCWLIVLFQSCIMSRMTQQTFTHKSSSILWYKCNANTWLSSKGIRPISLNEFMELIWNVYRAGLFAKKTVFLNTCFPAHVQCQWSYFSVDLATHEKSKVIP